MSRIDAARSARLFSRNTPVSKMEGVKPEAVQDQQILHEDELDAVSGGRAGSDKLKYMEIKLKEVLISSV